MRIALALGLSIAALATPSAHAGCVEDYLGSDSYYIAPRQDTVAVSGGVVTVNTNNAVGDANEVANFGVLVVTNEAGEVVALVDCVV